MTTETQGAPRTYDVRTYGCQMNVHDSERISGLLEDAGYVRAPAPHNAEAFDADVEAIAAATQQLLDSLIIGRSPSLSTPAPRSP